MRSFFSVAALLVCALAVQAQPPQGGGPPRRGGGLPGRGAGYQPKNLQVLTPATFPQAMQNFVAALGLEDKGACSFCPVQDRSSDEKMEKRTARKMLLMVREINAKFPDGKQHVTCYTCHRGSTLPATEPEADAGRAHVAAR